MTVFPIGKDTGLDRLVALALRCQDEGHMNLNKFFEAVVYSQTRRAGREYRPKITAANLLEELDTSLQILKQIGLDPQLISVIEIGRRAIAEQRHGDMTYEEAPDVFVCRTCGLITLSATPAKCSDCGAWYGNFRKFVAIFNADNYEPSNPANIFSSLAQNAAALQELVSGFTDEQLLRAHPGSDWTIRDHIAHFYDTQEMMDGRVEKMLKLDNPDLRGLAAYEIATDTTRHPTTPFELLARFLEKRQLSLDRFVSLPLKDLWRTGVHSEFGQITILRQAEYIAFHEQTHLPEIEALCRQTVY